MFIVNDWDTHNDNQTGGALLYMTNSTKSGTSKLINDIDDIVMKLLYCAVRKSNKVIRTNKAWCVSSVSVPDSTHSSVVGVQRYTSSQVDMCLSCSSDADDKTLPCLVYSIEIDQMDIYDLKINV